MVEETLPGTADDDDSDNIVLHVDMDCFHATCEHLHEPEPGDGPVIIGMGYGPGEGHGAVATVSYETHEFDVNSARPIPTALERLPHIDDFGLDDNPATAGHYRTVDLEFYKSVAADVKAVLHDCAGMVCEVSIDEAYLNVTNRTMWDLAASGDRTLAEGFARYVEQRTAREVGIAASIGVTPNVSTARIASDFDKPDGLVVARPGEMRSFLTSISVRKVHGVGPVTARELESLSIETVGDLTNADATVLETEFDSRGREPHERARGYDDRAATPTDRPKGLSRELAFTDPTDDVKDRQEVVRTLAADVIDCARSRGTMYRTIGIKVVVPPFDINTRTTSLSGPVDDPELVELVTLDLLSAGFMETTVRKFGIRASKLSFVGADQSSSDGWESAEAGETGGGGDKRVSDEPPNTGGEAPSRGGQSPLVEFD